MKLLIALLCLALVCPVKSQEKPIAAVGVGVVVVCVGGYCIYKVIKICQKRFPPKDTNAPPAELYASGDEYGGAYEYSSIGSCYVMPELNSFPYEDLNRNPTTFTLSVLVQNGAVTTSMKADSTEGTTQTWDQFHDEMASHGLFLTGHPSYQAQYERNGIPCEPSAVPIEFEPYTGKVITGHGNRITIERSPNLVDWSPLLVTEVSDGTGFKCVDCTRETQMFYRVISSKLQ